MIDSLMAALGFIGDVVDTPGSWVRNTLAGENPFKGTLSPENRTSGRKMLEALGIIGGNTDGLDRGDIYGFLAEMALDPTNLIGAGLLRNTAKAAKAAKASNAASDAMRAVGAMPEEIARLTKITDEAGAPRNTYHGSTVAFEKFDPAKSSPDNLFGRGYYTTSSPDVASSYAGIDSRVPDSDIEWLRDSYTKQGLSPNVRRQFLDIRNPMDMDKEYGQEMLDRFYSQSGDVEAQFIRQANRETFGDVGPIRGDQVWDIISGRGYRADDATRFLKEYGFDGIVHKGGTRMGGLGDHDVAIAFDPSQIYQPMIAPRHIDPPNARRLVAAILGYNTAMAPERVDDVAR